jgi:hypothetical protein
MPIPITDLKQGPGKFTLYGRPGTGKTALATSFGEGAEVLDIGRGLQTALTLKDEHYDKRIKCVVTPCYDDTPRDANAWDKFKARIYQIGDECKNGKYPYKCVIADELTAMGIAASRYTLRIGGRLPDPNFIPTVKTAMTQPEWGIAMNEISNMLIVMRSLPVHCILVAHDVTEDDENAFKKTINALGRKLAPMIPGFFDEYLYMKVLPGNPPTRVLQTQTTDEVVARTRGQLPNPYNPKGGMRKLMEDAGFSPDLK